MQPRRRFLTISVSCLHILFFFFPRPKTAYHPLTQVKNTCVKSINCHSRRYRNQTITLLPIIQQIQCHLIYVIKQLRSTNHHLIFPLFKPFSSTLYSHSIFCYSYYTPIYPMRINLSEDKTSFCFLYSLSKRCSAKSSLESSIISSLLSNLSISSDK